MIRLIAWLVVARDVATWALIACGVIFGLPLLFNRIAELFKMLGL